MIVKWLSSLTRHQNRIAKQAAGEPQLKPRSTWPGQEIRGFEPDGIETKEHWVGTSERPQEGRGPQSLVRFGTNMY